MALEWQVIDGAHALCRAQCRPGGRSAGAVTGVWRLVPAFLLLRCAMSSAAAISRQLRQQNTGRGAPPPGKGRQRALSHQPLTSPQLQQLQKKEEEKKKVGTLQSIRNKVTVQCLWLTCKALSGGLVLLLIGTAMSVVGFYAEALATERVAAGNRTVAVTDPDRQYHLHNLTYVGPVIMGLGGFVIVAAFVLTFEGHDSGARVVPLADDPATDALLLSAPAAPAGPYLCVPGPTFELPKDFRRPPSVVTLKAPPPAHAPAPVTAPLPPNGPRPPPTLPLGGGRMRNRELLMMQLCLDEFVPSPQDIEILDPDGCDTPRGVPPPMDMEVYVASCPITVRVQVEPRHLASMESDGLSDSDISDPGARPEQQRPLLGRCSPALSSPELRRLRFPLLRQAALDSHVETTLA